MNLTSEITILIFAGCLGGFISGLLGVGGGIVFVPILDYFLVNKYNISGKELVSFTLANSFFAILVSGFIGSYKAFLDKTINQTQLFSVAISAVCSILLTSYLIGLGNWYTPIVFKLVFSLMLLYTLVKTMMHIEIKGTKEKLLPTQGVLIGILTGVVSGLSGLGGGIIMIPLFMIFCNFSIKKSSMLSLAVIPILALPNIVFYAFQKPVQAIDGSTGYLVWALIIPLIIGVLICIKLGLKTAQLLSPNTIKVIFASFIILTIIKTLTSI